MLQDDLDDVMDHAARHWSFATGTAQTN